MSNQDMGGAAFPPNAGWRDNDPNCRGATLWDYYAAAALQGYLASPSADPHCTFTDYASDAATQADAMLAERAKRQEGGDE